MTQKGRIVSGALGFPVAYCIECILVGSQSGAARGVGWQVELSADAALAMVWQYRPELNGVPRSEMVDLDDDDEFLDVLIEAVHAYLATFPLWSNQLS